jgi:hypothetical protein
MEGIRIASDERENLLSRKINREKTFSHFLTFSQLIPGRQHRLSFIAFPQAHRFHRPSEYKKGEFHVQSKVARRDTRAPCIDIRRKR